MGNHEAAEALHRETVTALEETLGTEHVTTLVATGRLARLLAERDRAVEAEDLFRRAAEGLERILGADHLYTLDAVDGLAGALVAQERYADAEPLARRAADGFRAALGDEDDRTRAAEARLPIIADR